MGGGLLNIKIRNSSNPPETRKLSVPSNIKWNDLEKEIRALFSEINSNDIIQLKYRDLEGDIIHISTDGELSSILCTLNEESMVKFDLVIKPNPLELLKFEIDDEFVDITKNILQQWLSENLPNLIDKVTREVVNSIERKKQLISQDYISTSIENVHKVFTYPSKKIQGKIGATVE
ncbi:10036_t:CDS:2, partial [Dentiscutata heterogama]